MDLVRIEQANEVMETAQPVGGKDRELFYGVRLAGRNGWAKRLRVHIIYNKPQLRKLRILKFCRNQLYFPIGKWDNPLNI